MPPLLKPSAIRDLFVVIPARVRLTIPKLRQAQFGAPYLLAAQSSAMASVFIYDSGLEALPIGRVHRDDSGADAGPAPGRYPARQRGLTRTRP